MITTVAFRPFADVADSLKIEADNAKTRAAQIPCKAGAGFESRIGSHVGIRDQLS
jgi:hypothetical protein